jgi:hypothetical protein
MRTRIAIQLIGFTLAALQSAAADVASPATITSKEVMGAMERKKLPVDGAQITMPVSMRSTVKNPVLDIEQTIVLDKERSQLRVACHVRSECMPFYATVRWSAGGGAASMAKEKTVERKLDVAEPVALQAGAHATLILDDEHLHIRVPVICVSRGVPGDKIKVTSTYHHQMYEAVVLNAAELKGSF